MNPKDVVGKTKPQLALIPPSALIEVAKVAQVGDDKYGPFNWREIPIEVMQYLHAMHRHLAAFLDGENNDTESGASHLAHVIQTAAIVIDAQACGTLIDNRPKPGPAARLIREAIKHSVESHDTTANADGIDAVLKDGKVSER
jgi:hypothetical protein